MRKLVLTTTADGDASFIADLLIEHGALSTSVTDRHVGTTQEQQIDVENIDELTASAYRGNGLRAGELWREAVIEAWLPSHVDAEGVAMSVAVAADTYLRHVQVVQCNENEGDDTESWVREMRKYVRPVHVDNTYISYADDEYRSETIHGESVVNIVLDAGAAFGTGHHATTQLCLRWLQHNLPPISTQSSTTLLDYGCGNGVLALRAAMHHEHIVAVGLDIDKCAVTEARENATRNRVEDRCTFMVSTENEIDHQMFDIVVANILATTLVDLSTRVVAQLKVGGKIALSGMLASQAVQVTECYEKLGVRLNEGEVQSEWTILSGVKVR